MDPIHSSIRLDQNLTLKSIKKLNQIEIIQNLTWSIYIFEKSVQCLTWSIYISAKSAQA